MVSFYFFVMTLLLFVHDGVVVCNCCLFAVTSVIVVNCLFIMTLSFGFFFFLLTLSFVCWWMTVMVTSLLAAVSDRGGSAVCLPAAGLLLSSKDRVTYITFLCILLKSALNHLCTYHVSTSIHFFPTTVNGMIAAGWAGSIRLYRNWILPSRD